MVVKIRGKNAQISCISILFCCCGKCSLNECIYFFEFQNSLMYCMRKTGLQLWSKSYVGLRQPWRKQQSYMATTMGVKERPNLIGPLVEPYFILSVLLPQLVSSSLISHHFILTLNICKLSPIII